MGRKAKSVEEIKFVAPEPAEPEIPRQPDFYKLPTRFGAVPVDEAPLGWEVETRRRETKVTRFRHAYPVIHLPFQEVQRVEFGHGKDFPATELFPSDIILRYAKGPDSTFNEERLPPLNPDRNWCRRRGMEFVVATKK